MASFLKHWFGGKAAPPPHLAEAFAELDALARARPSLDAACRTLGAILAAIFTEPMDESRALSLALRAGDAQAKLAEAMPVLRGVPLHLDEAAFGRRWLAVCAAIGQPDAQILAEALRKQTIQPIALLDSVLAGHPEAVAQQFAALGVDASVGATVLRLTALPVLAKFAPALAKLRTSATWEHGYCPTCGSWPLLGELRGLEPIRYLRCGLCAASWEAARFRCAFCSNDDHHTLGYFHVEGEEGRCRAATCDECRGYVKLVSTLSPLSEPLLLVKDLASLHLDLVAGERGYFVPQSG